MAKVLAFTNNKGGSGKSTLCSNPAHIVASTGARVLIVDLTSQTPWTNLFQCSLFQCSKTTLRFIKAEALIRMRSVRVVINLLGDRYLPAEVRATSDRGELYSQVQKSFSDILCPFNIPESANIWVDFDRGMSIKKYKPNSLGARRIQAFVNCEVLDERV
jgi:cellulose biosynthesis protein BcsQ